LKSLIYRRFSQKINEKRKLTMVCKTVWDNLGECVGFGDELVRASRPDLVLSMTGKERVRVTERR